MRRLAIQFAFGFGALFMGALTFAAVAGFFTFTGDPLKKLGLIIRIPLLVAATVALARQALKVPKTPEPFFTSVKDQLEGLPELRDIYLARHLASSARGDFTSYSSVSNSELLGVAENIKPELAPERTAELLSAIKHRVETSYLPDGSQCQAHAPQLASSICSRCGSFFCPACASTVKSHCAPCLKTALTSR